MPSNSALDGRREALSDQERPVVGHDERLAGGDKRGRICSGGCGLSQGHERREGHNADVDHAGFKGANGDKAKRHAFVLPPDHRKQRGGGADASECDDHLEQAAPEQNSDNLAISGSASDCRTAVP